MVITLNRIIMTGISIIVIRLKLVIMIKRTVIKTNVITIT